MDENIRNILNIIEMLESRINAYWNFYTIVVLAMTGWLLSSKITFDLNQRIALTLAFLVFLINNFFVMRAVTKRVVAFESELNLLAKDYDFKSSLFKYELSHNPIPMRLICSYILHIIIDAVVIYAIWI
jgi:hypothetical protein